MKLKLTILSSLIFTLVSCGSESGANLETPSDSETQGVVADGYLENAYVCLDLNGNLQCDANEPSDTTDSTGSFNIESDDTSQYSIIVEVGADAIDSDTSDYVEQAYVLTAPAGVTDFISPITTLIQTQLLANANLSLEDAEAELAESLGLADADDLYSDFISDPELDTLHAIARTVASGLGSALQALKDSSGYTSDDLETAIKVSALLVNQKLEDLIYSVRVAEAENEDAIPSDIVENELSGLISGTASEFSLILSLEEKMGSAAYVNAKDTFAAGLHEIEAYFDFNEYNGVVTNSEYSYEERTTSVSVADILESTWCEWEYDFLSEEVLEDECETDTGFSGNYTSVRSNWILNDENLLVEATYNGYNYYSIWLDDSTRKDVIEYLLDDSLVTQISKTSQVYVDELSLDSTNIQDFITYETKLNWMEVNDIYIGLDFNEDIFDLTESELEFSDQARAYIVTKTPIDVDNPIETAIGISDEDYARVDYDNLSIDEAITNGYLFDTECIYEYIYYSDCYVKLNASEGETTGTATLIDTVTEWDDELSQSIVIGEIELSTVSWSRETLYGKDSIVFDLETLSEGVELDDMTAIVDLGDGQIIYIEPYTNFPEYSQIEFNQAAMDEIKALFDRAIEDYLQANLE